MTISLTYDEKIAILDLGDDENRFSPRFLDDIGAHLDDIVASGADGLVTTATGKFYTNGLDLDSAPTASRPSGTSGGCRDCWPAYSPFLCPPRPRSLATPSAPGQCWPWPTIFE
jgi:hypothetical protein